VQANQYLLKNTYSVLESVDILYMPFFRGARENFLYFWQPRYNSTDEYPARWRKRQETTLKIQFASVSNPSILFFY